MACTGPSPIWAGSTPAQAQLIKEGVALHDQGVYDGAISRYEQVLKENPNNVHALYELAYTYFQKRDYRKSLEISNQAIQFKSDLLPQLYVQIGSCLDELGESKQAIEVYKSAAKIFPADYLIPYNLAVTYTKLNALDDARAAAKRAAELNPNHASSQLLLATIFDKGSYKTPSLLAVSRFLILEPKSARSEAGLRLLRKLMQGGVQPGKDNNTINIFMDAAPKKDEGDFGAIDLAISLTKVAEHTEKNKDKTEMQRTVSSFETLLAILSETAKPDRSKFTWRYYHPYFVALKTQGHVEAFVYYIHQHSGSAEVNQWLADHGDKVKAFIFWSRSYPWPEAD